MFCYQCEQTAKGEACTVSGVCGKKPDIAALQDLLVHGLKGISQYMHKAYELGSEGDAGVDLFVVEGLFVTITNVNFDANRFVELINKAYELKEWSREIYETVCAKKGKTPETLSGPAAWTPAEGLDELVKQGEKYGIQSELDRLGPDKAGLYELIIYGLKGMAAYADHAQVLGQEDKDVYKFFHEAMSFLAAEDQSIDALLGMSLKTGEINIRVMELLDQANTGTYGHPEPTQVRITPIKGKAILVSGHDLKDLELLLKQTEGKGINIYTHSEMLPCNAYPELKKYSHLAGNYGGAWQDQKKEFAAFPGPILMTTNCIMKPQESYFARIYTTSLVGWPGVKHLVKKDFTPIIEDALAAEGFTEDAPEKRITIGFAHNSVLGVAGTVVEAVKSGALKHFFLIGGCDGAAPGRNYYTELAEQVPKDCVILTLACGKYRFNKLEFGDIGGIPRLLDCGQCNDAFSAVKIAMALADAFETDVNGLPLSIVLSWFEQKAVCILLSLLHLGVKDMRLGPNMPAFVSPTVYSVLKEKFNLMPTTTADADLKAILG